MTHDVALGAVALFGAAHGLNPAMGWLFAVSLGLQEQNGHAVWRALVPLGLGHACAVAAALALAALLGVVMPIAWVRWIAAGALLATGCLHLMRQHYHPRGRMHMGPRDLTMWSFLMASAHGAGLMLVPFVIDATPTHSLHSLAGLHPDITAALVAMALHTVSYLAISGALAWIVYDRLGLRVLRTAWINVNVIWAAALIATGLITIL